VIGTNLIGAYFTAKCAIPHLKKRGGGKIITIGSYFSYAASEGRSAYCCSKAGLSVLTRVLAEELREFDISVNELLPASVATKMNRKINPDEKTKTFQSITSLAVFLAAQPNIYPSGQSFSLYAKPIK
jgi:3-oxoacyl-[acyl-carrier protein] reductase